MIYPPLGEISYIDGTTFKQAGIHQSQNGWTYKPDALRTEKQIRQGKNKVWPRGEGATEAREWMWSDVEAHFEKTGWEVPIHIEDRITNPYGAHRDSLSVAWYTKLYGWVVLSLSIEKSELTYDMSISKVAKLLLFRSTADIRLAGYRNNSSNIVYSVGVTNVQERVKAFMQDPWSSFKQFNENLEWDEIVGTPPDLADLEYEKDWDGFSTYDRHDSTPVGEVRSTSSGNGLFFHKGKIEEVFEDQHNWEQLNSLFNALQFTGFTVRPQWSYSYNRNNRLLSGIQIEIPKQGEMEAHTVNIKSENPQVTIKCGFQRDEDKWIDMKKRQAQEQMAELTRDLEAIEYTIEL